MWYRWHKLSCSSRIHCFVSKFLHLLKPALDYLRDELSLQIYRSNLCALSPSTFNMFIPTNSWIIWSRGFASMNSTVVVISEFERFQNRYCRFWTLSFSQSWDYRWNSPCSLPALCCLLFILKYHYRQELLALLGAFHIVFCWPLIIFSILCP